VQHEEVVHNPKLKKASKMFKPAKIVYPEDRIRKAFYKDHPWELARPRMVLEQDGKDGQKYDWSKIEQRGRELNGERYGITKRSSGSLYCIPASIH
jgi:small subunit ribosomal protein S23